MRPRRLSLDLKAKHHKEGVDLVKEYSDEEILYVRYRSQLAMMLHHAALHVTLSGCARKLGFGRGVSAVDVVQYYMIANVQAITTMNASMVFASKCSKL